MILLLLACGSGPGAVEVRLWSDDAVQVEVLEVELRAEDTEWSEPWEVVPLQLESVELTTEPMTIALGELPPGRYLQVFPDVGEIVWQGSAVEDIVEPIAAPLQLRPGRSQVIEVELALWPTTTGSQGLFAVDTRVGR